MLPNTLTNPSTYTGNLLMARLDKMGNRSQILQMSQPSTRITPSRADHRTCFCSTHTSEAKVYILIYRNTLRSHPVPKKEREVTGNLSSYKEVSLSFQTYFVSLERLCTGSYRNLSPSLPTVPCTCAPSEMAPGWQKRSEPHMSLKQSSFPPRPPELV